MYHAESVALTRFGNRAALRRAYGIADLPNLIDIVAGLEPERIAVRDGDAALSYAVLATELGALAEAMGGALEPDALVQVVLSGQLPGLMAGAAGALATVLEDLLADALDAAAGVLTPDLAPIETLVTLFEKQVRRTPDAIALQFGEITLTYAEFDARANALARRLRQLGVGPDALVDLAMRRSIELLVGMYAILKAGSGYVPVDPDHPAERISYVLATAAPAVVLTTTADQPEFDAAVPVLRIDEFEAGEPDAAASAALSPSEDPELAQPDGDNIAYVIFTSGSTGRPKGVAVSHRSIVANLRWRQRLYRLHADDAVLQKTPFTFDVSVWEFFWPLQVGARLVIAEPDGHRDPPYLLRTIADAGVTVAHFVPSMLSVFVAEAAATEARGATGVSDSLRLVFASGEALPAATAAGFRDVSGATLHNLYGPTEAAVDVTAHEVTAADRETVPIGAAADDTDLLVLDEHLRPVPPGVVGELYLAGVQLARGYVARPALTAERFIANPEGAPGDRMYRTGDLVRWQPAVDGGPAELEYLGRSDFQVKLRGLRIELGEVEAALLRHAAVAQAAVLLHTRANGDGALVGYVVAAADQELDTAAVLTAVRAHVPGYMAPSLLVVLAEMPLNPNGKLDRRALPEPEFGDATVEYREPETLAEHAVAAVFAELLAVDRVGADDDFFALGGNSLIATRAIARVARSLGIDLDMRDFFDRPSVAALAALADAAAVAAPRPALEAGPRPEHVPLSPAQQRMWFLNEYSRIDSDTAAAGFDPAAVDNMPFALRLRGAIDRPALAAAVTDLLDRHESLRTRYPLTPAGPAQIVLPAPAVDLTPVDVPEHGLVAAVIEAAAAGFDVTAEAPLRVRLLRLAAEDHVLVLVAHHIAADGASMAPLLRDLVTAYAARCAGARPEWAPLAVQYADYALWQRQWLGDDADPDSTAARQIRFWTTELDDLPAQLDLLADRPRPAVSTYRGATLDTALGPELTAAVHRMAARHRATPFMVLHAALAALLARLSGTTDIAIGAPVAGRGDRALDDLVGMFVNTLVLRADVPFERLVEVLDPPRAQHRHPLFQVALFMQNLGEMAIVLPGLAAEPVEFDPGFAKFDLQLTVTGADDYRIEFTYATDLFDAHTVREFAAKFTRLLTAATADATRPVGDIELLDAGELDYVLSSWNATGHKVADRYLHEGFDAQASRTPDVTALVFGDTALSYAELSARANRLARLLIADGVGPEALVVLAMARSVDLVVAMYAVLRAGGAYVPVDPGHPADRVGHILATARPHAVFTTHGDGFALPETATVPVHYLDELEPDGLSAAKITDREHRAPLLPDHPAYVLFTSGSTGKPKGVSVTHRAIANQLAWMQSEYRVRADDVYLQKTATTFDVSLWGYFLPLRAGATLVVATPDGHRDPRYIAETIARQRVTLTDFVPAMLAVFAAHAERAELRTLRDVFAIGEALPPETVAAFRAVSDAGLHNLYGPTEAAVSITAREATGEEATTVPIGEPEWNSEVYVLDARLRPAPIGVPGELYLAGVQLARGYHGRVDLTSDRFVANPFGRAGQRMYRTGDLVAWNQDGELVYLGRSDFQIKFRGQRIELAEIESALLLDPAVSQAAARLVTGETGDYLAAYAIPASGARLDLDRLKDGLARVLPSYMVPTAIVELAEFPLNTSGKLDRRALPLPVLRAKRFRAPVDATQRLVAGVFAEVLRTDRVGLDDDFFALGGSSLDATKVTARIGAELGARIPVRTLFDTATVEGFAAAVAARSDAAPCPPLRPRPRPARIPLSPAQQRLWFLNRMESEDGGRTVYNLPLVLRLSGRLDVLALERAVLDVLARHEALRTCYPDTEFGPYQRIMDAAEIGLTLHQVPVTEAEIPAAIAAVSAAGFDVTRELPSRIALLAIEPGEEVGASEFVLVVVVHHIAADALSMTPLVADLMRSYDARLRYADPGWEPLAVQYADYSLWQHAPLGSAERSGDMAYQQLEFWRAALAGLAPQLPLPTDRPRPAVAANIGAAVDFSIDPEVTARLRALARAHNATLFMLVHAAFATTLARLCGTGDVAIGTPIGGRGERELDALIGMFVNTLVLRTEVDGELSFAELLTRVRDTDLAAFAHAELPFERLVDALAVDRTTGAHPLFQVMLSLTENTRAPALTLPELTVTPLEIDDPAVKFDLHLVMTESGERNGLSGSLRYATELFDAATAASFATRFARVLEAVAADGTVRVGDIELLDATERNRILTGWNDTARPIAEEPVVELFRAQAERTPQAPALVVPAGYARRAELTYAEFAERVHRLARRLVEAGVGPETLVALGMRRSPELVVAAYAVLEAGGAYVPLDLDQPEERLAHLLETAAPVCVLTTASDRCATDIPTVVVDELDLAEYDAVPLTDADRIAPLRPSNTAYVIFTSGSTGRPKGVAVPHAAVVNQIRWITGEYGMTAADIVLFKTPQTFDVSVWELFGPLAVGARMVVADADGHRDPRYLAEVIAAERVTMTSFVPSMLTVFAGTADPGRLSTLRALLIAGEALTADVVHAIRRVSAAGLHNLYGPTEFTVHATHAPVADDVSGAVPIGLPVWNARAYVLDSRLHPVAPGIAGELYLAGDQLARGYAGRMDLTADRFVANPFGAGERMYRTGDLVRRAADGSIAYLGRTDFQVKLRGLRIELGEIESALTALDSIARAVVMVRDDHGVGGLLVAYLIAAASVQVSVDDVEAEVARRLPGYMVPSAWVVLDEFPVNASGKLDRRALPAPAPARREFQAPAGATEILVAETFTALLGLARVGADDDFFALGGNSLIATQLVARLAKATGVEIGLRALFETPTVRGLAARLLAGAVAAAAEIPPLTAQDRGEIIPLSIAQQRMWFLNRFDARGGAYNIPFALRLTGALDLDALRAAIADVIDRHETLRTLYPEHDGEARQLILPVRTKLVDIVPETIAAEQIPEVLAAVARTSFDVTAEVPLRARLLRVESPAAPPAHILLVVVHHIAADGWSFAPLTRDLATAYVARCAGSTPFRTALPVQYADYALWQRKVLGRIDDDRSVLARQLGHWTDRLAGLPEVITLPADRPRPAVASNRGGAVTAVLDAESHRAVLDLASERRVTPFIVLHTALAVLLHRLGAGADIAIGAPVAGRGDEALDDLVGMFVNTLVLRTEVPAEATLAELLAQVLEVDLTAFEQAAVPFEQIVEAVNPVRSQAHAPLYQVSLTLQNQREPDIRLHRLEIAALDTGTAPIQFDLDWTLNDRYTRAGDPEGIDVHLRYAADLFDSETAAWFVTAFERVVRALTTDTRTRVGEVELMSVAERGVLLSDRNATVHPVPRVTLCDLLDRRATSAAAVALTYEGEAVTYGRFDDRVNRLARLLIAAGVGPESIVGLAVPRSIDLVTGIMAIVRAGGAYLPIDPEHPVDRIAHILDTARPAAILTLSDVALPTPEGVRVLELDRLELDGFDAAPIDDAERRAPLTPAYTAYVIFTSGSTGRPKGVAVSHTAIVNRLVWMQAEYGLTAGDVVLQKTPATFDVSVWEFFWPLQIGARLVVAKPDGHRDPAYLARLIADEQVTTAHFVPSMLSVFVAEESIARCTSLRMVFASGEALPAGIAQRLRDSTGARLHNLYGPTEAAVDVTFHEVTDADTATVPIGAPVFNTRVYVLDSRLRPVPSGAAGELYLAGEQLARGYTARPDLTSDRFVADPFGVPGTRMYRTGDLVKWNRAGELEYLGRNDFQVKLRGLRIELGEIEAALLGLETVAQAAVLLQGGEDGGALVAYVVPSRGADADPALRAEITAALARELPAYMVPSALQLLDELPLNASGKLDRKALPAVELLGSAGGYRAPREGAEAVLAALMAALMGGGADIRIGADDDFFARGGNSLLAMRLVARANAALGCDLTVRDVFEAPTVAALALRATRAASAALTAPLVARQRPDRIPLSLAQTRMWLLHRLDPDSAVYHIPIVIRLGGALDREALQAAVADVLERHESLRTVFPEDADGPHQVVLSGDGFTAPALTPVAVTTAELTDAVLASVSRPFRLRDRIPVHSTLFRLASDDHVLSVVVHHIAADGVSTGPLARDLMAAYAARTTGAEPALPPLRVQYADFTLWQHDVLGSPDDPESVLAQQIAHWCTELAGLAPVLELPGDRPRPAVATGRGASIEFDIPAETTAAIAAFARAQGVSTFMVVHAAFAALLSRLAATDDIAIGTPVAGRAEEALDDLVGMFVNTLVLRTAVHPATLFTDLLTHVRDTDVRAFANADLPFERLVEELNPVRSQAHSPIVQVLLAFEHRATDVLELPGLEVSAYPLGNQVAQFDLALAITEVATADAPALRAILRYATDLFDAPTVEAFARRFLRLLATALTTPEARVGDIDLLDAPERELVVSGWNATAFDVAAELAALTPTALPSKNAAASADAARTLAALFEAQVGRTPDAAAITFEHADTSLPATSLSYAEFAARARRLARHLITQGVEPGAVVALGMRRSIDLVVGMYAVVLAGGAYLPLDPDHPAERTEYVLDIACPVTVLTSGADLGIDTAQVRIDLLDLSVYSDAPITDADRRVPLRKSNNAYVIFTSGSTGRPKGVAVPHSAIVNRLVWMQSAYGLTAADVVLQKTPSTFDVSVWEFFWPLQVGAHLVVAKPEGHRDPAYLAELIAREGVTVTHFVPSMLTAFVSTLELGRSRASDGIVPFVAEDAAARCTSLRMVFASGEALSPKPAHRLRELTGAELHNLYGPTEAAVDVTYHQVVDADVDSVPIGRPVYNTAVYVLDARLRPVPVGVAGELYLAGDQLATGYVARPDLTSDRFVANPFRSGERMYRTGDLVKWTSDGDLEYLGRTDFQVKLRGLRIELGEIETALTAVDSVAQAVVVVRTDDRLGEQLVGYVVPAGEIDLDGLRARLVAVLPSYMVPSAFVVLEALPVNASGKLDRRALPAPVFATMEYRAPVTAVEQAIAEVFGDLLGVERIGLDDGFFALGGNSLIATQAVALLGAMLDAEIPVRLLFEASTVADLAARADGLSGTGGRLPLTARPRPELVPLSAAQRRMWFLNRFDPAEFVHNIPVALRLTGVLDAAALTAAVSDVTKRHETLRTVYPDVNGVGYQRILAPAATPIAELDADRAALAAFTTRPFDVTAEAPLRIGLARIAADEHILVLVVHHIAADGFSMGPLARDIAVAYAARAGGGVPEWDELPVQYADYALWQAEALGAEDDPDSLAARQLAFWRNTLRGLPAQLDLPMDRPRPAVASHAAAAVSIGVDTAIREGIAALAAQYEATEFMVVHAALAVLLARLSGTTDIVIGAPVAGRGHAALDDLVGMFVNTLVLRAEVSGAESFAALLRRVADRDLDAFAHAEAPFERLVEALDPPRSEARHPLFQIALFYQNLTPVTMELGRMTVAEHPLDHDTSRFDLQLTVTGDAIRFTYATDIFDATTMESFAGRLLRLLSEVIADPELVVGDIDLFEAGERHRILTDRNDSSHPVPAAELLLDGFEAQAAATPERIALRYAPEDGSAGAELTYGELDRRANGLARQLIGTGVGPETLVALAIRRSPELVIAMYAVLKAGGAYVPIDPDHPAQRIAHILDTARPVALLSTTADRIDTGYSGPTILVDAVADDGCADSPLLPGERRAPVHPDQPAYVIFTSGSTGKPKGVSVTHAAIANQMAWMRAEYRLAADDVYLQKTATTFDVSLWGYFLPLQVGATLLIATPDGHRDPGYLVDTIDEYGVTVTDFVPSMLSVFATHGDSARLRPALRTLRQIFVIGEALPAETVRAFGAVCDARLHNLYGPTEVAVSITYRDVTGEIDRTVMPIGRPEWNSRVYVLDSRLRPTLPGVAGELYLSGIQLARGYHGRADLTADRFVADPFGAAGERMHRTGDLVRWEGDGPAADLVYLGRTDFQVKFRGQRIELGEIEAALAAVPGVAQAAAQVVTTVTGDHLIGYVTTAESLRDTAEFGDGVRHTAAASLPSYMIPAAILVLAEFPLNASGKLDRKALPDASADARLSGAFGRAAYRAPVTGMECLVAAEFEAVLGVDRIGVDDDFFDLGGNSLVAMRVLARIGDRQGRRIPVRLLFEAPTVAGLAARLAGAAGTPDADLIPLVAGPRPEVVPLSPTQRGMWLLNRLDPRSGANNLPAAVRILGDLDEAAMRAAFADVIARHEALRTLYPVDDTGAGRQVVLPVETMPTALELRTGYDTADTEWIAEFVGRGFDVTAAVPLRAMLVRESRHSHVLAAVLHHIAGDGQSMNTLLRDIVSAYLARTAGSAPVWPELPVQYADYALWQRATLARIGARELAYWTERLRDLPEDPALPTDRPRPAVASQRGAVVRARVDGVVASALQRIAKRHNATPFMVWHAALSVLLARLTGADDIAIGTPVAGRGGTALDDVVGMFVNTLVLRTRPESELGFTDLVARTRDADLAAFAHATVPFEQVVDALGVPRSQARNPLFTVALSYLNLGVRTHGVPGLVLEPVEFDHRVAKFDLQFTVSDELDADGHLAVELNYATDLFDAATAAGLLRRFGRLLGAVTADPGVRVGEIDLLSPTERADLLDRPEAHAVPLCTLGELLTTTAAAHPHAVALRYAGRELTYRELDSESSRLARILLERGVGAEDFVAVAVPRSDLSVLAVWAVTKTGAAFVPVDPTYPADRIAHMLADSGAAIGLTIADCRADLPGSADWLVIDSPELLYGLRHSDATPIAAHELRRPARPANPAWMIYTSGSTGVPNGVLATHGGVAGVAPAQRDRYQVTGASRVLHVASPSFDACMLELLLAVAAGATMVVAPAGVFGGAELTELMCAERVTHAFITPGGAANPGSGSPRRSFASHRGRLGLYRGRGRAVGRHPQLLQHLRSHRDHHHHDHQLPHPPRRCLRYGYHHRRHVRGRPGCPFAAGAARRHRRAVPERSGGGTRIPCAPRSFGSAFHCRPVRRSG